MMKRFAAVVAVAMLAQPALAAPKAKKLAETDLRDAKDWDLVRLPPCSNPNNMLVNRLQVVVTKHPAQIDRLKVEFYNNDTEVLNVRERFKAGSSSRWIDMPGAARCIKTIRIVGDTDSLGWRPGKQAHVSFLGLNFRGKRRR